MAASLTRYGARVRSVRSMQKMEPLERVLFRDSKNEVSDYGEGRGSSTKPVFTMFFWLFPIYCLKPITDNCYYTYCKKFTSYEMPTLYTSESGIERFSIFIKNIINIM